MTAQGDKAHATALYEKTEKLSTGGCFYLPGLINHAMFRLSSGDRQAALRILDKAVQLEGEGGKAARCRERVISEN